MKNLINKIKKPNTSVLVHIFYMLCMFNFIFNKKINCLIISIATTLILHFIVKKKMEISMLISLMLSIFVFNCNKVIELNEEESSKSEKTSSETNKTEDDEKSSDLNDDSDLETELVTSDISKIAEEAGGDVDAVALQKAIENAKNAGLVIKTESAEEQRKKVMKRLDRKFKGCTTGTLKPINVCRDEINEIITGEDDDNDEEASSSVAY